jgi:hypothetical protein
MDGSLTDGYDLAAGTVKLHLHAAKPGKNVNGRSVPGRPDWPIFRLLGDFSPVGQLYTLGSFFESYWNGREIWVTCFSR